MTDTSHTDLREQIEDGLMLIDRHVSDSAMEFLLALITQQVTAARLDEIKETVLSAAQFGIDHSYSDYPFYVVEKPDVDNRINTLTAKETKL